MSDILWPDTDELVELLVRMNITMDPSEFQGALLGRVAGAPVATFTDHWDCCAGTFGDMREDSGLEELWQRLINLCMETLAEGHLELNLALPEDGTPLLERLDALAAWCRGFLFGLGISGVSEEQLALKEMQELLADIKAISEVGMDDTLDVDEQEHAYMELEEYLRMVPFLVYTTLYNVLDEEHSK